LAEPTSAWEPEATLAEPEETFAEPLAPEPAPDLPEPFADLSEADSASEPGSKIPAAITVKKEK
jgi:hypothetical protein